MDVCGGYFLTRPIQREDFMSSDLLPDSVISLSDCICNFIPDLWAVEWSGMEAADRNEEAARFGIAESAVPEIITWATEAMDRGAVGFPCMFFELSEARNFAARFVKVPDLELIGISLHADRVEEFLSSQKPVKDEGEPGIYSEVTYRVPAEPNGIALGWEVLCYEYGGFHSWLCNSLEVEVADELDIRPGATGLLESADDALRAAEHCGQDDVGAEPGFWAPWHVTRYPLRD